MPFSSAAQPPTGADEPRIRDGVWTFGRYRLDAAERRLTADGEVVALTPKAFDLLLLLVEKSDRLVRREEVIAALWPDAFIEDGTLARHVSALRKAIERNPGEQFVETVPKSGYRFLGAVRALPETAPVLPSTPPSARRVPYLLVGVLGLAVLVGIVVVMVGRATRRSEDSPSNVGPPSSGAGLESGLGAARPTEPGAQEAYLRARHFLSRRTAVDLRAASGLFEQALAAQPGYAAAEAGWATALALLASSEDSIRNVGAARAHAARAISLDPRCVEAYAALGLLAMNHDGDWAAAEASFRRALAIESNDVTTNHWLGEMLSLLGRSDEGLALLERAHRADPTSLIVATDIVKALFGAGRYDEAISRAQEVIERDPGFAQVYIWSGLAYLERGGPGDLAAGLASVRLHARLDHSPLSRGYLAWALGRAGEVAESSRLLEELELERRSTFIRPMVLAMAHGAAAGKVPHQGIGLQTVAIGEALHFGLDLRGARWW